MKNLKQVLAVLIFSIAGSSIAQSYTMLPQKSAGFGTNLGMVRAAGFQGYLYELGFNYYALGLDFGAMNVAYDKNNQNIETDNAKSQSKIIRASIWFLDSKLSDRIFMKVGVMGDLDFVSFDNYEFSKIERFGYSFYSSRYKLTSRVQEGFGIKSYININLENNWVFQPGFYIGYKFSQEEIQRLYMLPNEWNPKVKVKTSMSENVLGFTLGKTFKNDMRVFMSMKQYLYPLYNDNFTYLAVGFAFPLAESE